MTPARVRQRQRIVRARSVAERVAQAEALAANGAQAEARALAARLTREIGFVGGASGPASGAILAARLALADRLERAVVAMTDRQTMLDAAATLATRRNQAARLARRSAENLADQSRATAEAQAERRLTLPPRRQPGRAP